MTGRRGGGGGGRDVVAVGERRGGRRCRLWDVDERSLLVAVRLEGYGLDRQVSDLIPSLLVFVPVRQRRISPHALLAGGLDGRVLLPGHQSDV